MRTRKLFGAALAAHRRRIGRSTRTRRVVRRNPPRAARRRRSAALVVSRPSAPRMSPAMRRKVSLGVKRYFAQRKARRSTVGRVRSFASSAVSRYRSRRRKHSGGGSIMGVSGNSLTRILSKDVLMTGAGAVLASVGTGYILKNYGSKLPMASSKYGQVAYSLLIPSVGAAVVRKYNRNLSNGMLIGGVILAINALIRPAMAGTVGEFAAPVIQDEYGNFHEAIPGLQPGFSTYPDVQEMGLAGELTGHPSDFAVMPGHEDVETPFTNPW